MMIFWEIDNYTLDIHSILEAKFRNNLCTKKLSFSLRISSVNVTKSAGNCGIWSHLLKKSLTKPSSHLYLLQQRDYIATDLIFALTIFKMGGGGKRPLPENLSNISYNDETWHSYTLSKENPKSI